MECLETQDFENIDSLFPASWSDEDTKPLIKKHVLLSSYQMKTEHWNENNFNARLQNVCQNVCEALIYLFDNS